MPCGSLSFYSLITLCVTFCWVSRKTLVFPMASRGEFTLPSPSSSNPKWFTLPCLALLLEALIKSWPELPLCYRLLFPRSRISSICACKQHSTPSLLMIPSSRSSKRTQNSFYLFINFGKRFNKAGCLRPLLVSHPS